MSYDMDLKSIVIQLICSLPVFPYNCSSVHPESGMKVMDRAERFQSKVRRPGCCSEPYDPDLSGIPRAVPFVLCASVFSSKQK